MIVFNPGSERDKCTLIMLKITTPSRLHLTLIDMNASIGRVDGGIGLTLDEPVISIEAEKSDTFEITGNSEHFERMRNSVALLLPEGEGIHISIEKDYPSHVGLGSGTQAALAAGMAVNKIYNLGLSVYDLGIKVGRGGTSGIGVAAFEKGGFILDGVSSIGGKQASSCAGFVKKGFSRLGHCCCNPGAEGCIKQKRSKHIPGKMPDTVAGSGKTFAYYTHANASRTF